jgi:SAM-dependent methyltransferase
LKNWELGLTNIELLSVDLCDADRRRFGSFDYILAHGIYSWVPALTRERILALCHDLTAPHGIAYVSYNAYPGNHLWDLARGIIRFHTMRCDSPQEKVRRARAILALLANSRLTANAYVTALRSEFERVAAHPDELFFHDDLSEINQPFYFHEFIAAAQQHHLQFLGEAGCDDLSGENFTPEMTALLIALEKEEQLIREQYRDFALGRAFRRSLLCRDEVPLSPDFLTDRISNLYASCDAAPIDCPESCGPAVTLFRRPNGAELETNNELVAVSLRHLCLEWPCAVAFGVALDFAREKLSEVGSKDQESQLAEAWARAYKAGFLQFHVSPPRVVNSVSPRPECSALARFQLRKTGVATSQLHRRVRFEDSLSRDVAVLLDGSRDQETIIQNILDSLKTGHTELRQDGSTTTEPHPMAVSLKQRFHEILEALARQGLLIG